MSKTMTSWTTELTLKQTLSVLDHFSASHARRGGEHGSAILSLIEGKKYAELCSYELPQNEFGWDVSQLINCRQALAFYSKLHPLEIGEDKELNAWTKFVESEVACKQTNQLFRAHANGNVSFLPRVERVFKRARGKIARVLGPVPRIDQLSLRFGPGSTTSIKRSQAIPQNKLAEQPTCSVELFQSPYLAHLFESMPHWLDCHVDFEILDAETEVGVMDLQIDTGALEFVPKNAKTLRGIDKQPTLNTLIQSGIGSYIERRLERYGLGIRDQTKNQRLARSASISDDLATIDLSSASDTIALEAVRYLLPEGWFYLLRATGCRVTSYKGREIKLEKMSSMGNGYTFPLETIIFWALTASACEGSVGDVSCYGDDIICPAHKAGDVIEVLNVAGFAVNTAKSYVNGPFRESCGADYYLGIDIRPFYQKTLVSAKTLFLLHNWYYADGDVDRCQELIKIIPTPLRLFGPPEYGDGHLHSCTWDRKTKRDQRRKGYGGSYFTTYSIPGTKIVSRYPGDYVTPLYVLYTSRELPLLEYSEGIEFSRNGRPIWVAPSDNKSGVYEIVSIYTFC